MKRYKLIGEQKHWPSFKKGYIYPGNYNTDGVTIERCANAFPNDWQLVEDDKYVLNNEDDLSIDSIKNNSNIAIHVTTFEELKKCDELLDWDHEYLYHHGDRLSTYGANTAITHSNTFASVEYFLSKGIIVIKASDFIKHNTTMKEQTIVGYKLKPEFESIQKHAKDLMHGNRYWNYGIVEIHQHENIQKLKDLKVLDIWFEPIYKKEYKLPNISKYCGEDLGDKVKYGCQIYKVDDIKALYNSLSILTIDSVKLSVESTVVTIDQIEQIINYFKNK